ncbi:Pc15g01300 [Penicillium rubens Wisconsin 54-1255]|uniref:Pc15g01300 protein n=1 Tax=Penicillium rubens (strain ATCC 28089 / DSM 1075 / NRRL 1951 / Wisconsin 54-1255) TaxID=500485 RepID=B6H675_PENRW|nr:Pc15g01300 [Penicillium rubens Wisconsin 54-1255]
MLLDGEKWACEACVRGHRVSNCHHHVDRPLIRIGKKGRPITQCAHCRGLRESHTTHIKCECGKNVYDEDNFQYAGNNHQRCGCIHGQRCICALKKERTPNPAPRVERPRSQPASMSKLVRTPSDRQARGYAYFPQDNSNKLNAEPNDMLSASGMPYPALLSNVVCSSSDNGFHSGNRLFPAQAALLNNETSYSGFGNSTKRQSVLSNANLAWPGDPSPQFWNISQHSYLQQGVPQFGSFPMVPLPDLGNSDGTSAFLPSVLPSFDKIPAELAKTDVTPAALSPVLSTSTTSTTNVASQQTHEENLLNLPVDVYDSAGLGTLSDDWTDFPSGTYDPTLRTATDIQPPYTSFDVGTYSLGLPTLSSSDNTVLNCSDEVFGPENIQNDPHNLHSVSLQIGSGSQFGFTPR